MERRASGDDPGAIDARLAGAVWGYLLGDSLGLPLATLSATEIERGETAADHGIRERPAGTWSDAGALMLAVLDSLMSVGFDPEDQAERILDWYLDGSYASGAEGRFDADERTGAAAHAIERGVPASECGPADDDVGGGSAVKVALALGVVDPLLSFDLLLERALAASRILDGRPRAAIGTALYAGLVRETILGARSREQVAEGVVAGLRTACQRHADRASLVPAARDVLGRGRGRGGATWDAARPWDAVWAAWAAYLAADSPLDAIERAIRPGGETDTTAALAGGLAGARWGIESIPAAVLLSLRGRSRVGRLVDRLLSPAPAERESAHVIGAWIPSDVLPGGRLGIAALPGSNPVRLDRVRRRQLAADADHLEALGVDLLVLLVMDHELRPIGANAYVAAIEARGIEVLREPVAELDVPPSRERYGSLIAMVREALGEGRRVVVACRTGMGRASTFVACLLREEGRSADEALAAVREGRSRAIETTAQEAFLRGWQ
jgi:ADP-ribosylglycohydrolase/protein-tyrosine phosphatase